ncbi:HAMP domain-containing histidine kinase [Polynucleobacter sp. 30F-ANTBAC]|uniref:sensor histidine kinase n=1 Tax=Polynucleobacter sp. 30F-ANTBAC TaxID=2689095 RepID=UPI001C0DB801|nr:HAMP domain-containing sensor histidine kinase [Polynucleobacter sp. 30F-ANTBAC]MBU3599772.1 HAMP domain-containing histidine kinase [Polynucleobacter sp. 30F-ANTBAC]
MSTGSSQTPNIAIAQDLEAAFALFVDASKALEEQQLALQSQISQLSQELVEVNGRLSSLLNALPAGVILVENQIVIDFNPAAIQLIPDLKKGSFWNIPKSWKSSTTVGEYHQKHGQTEQILQVHQIDSSVRSVIQIQDITASISSHAERERVNRLAAMGKMSAGIAHQLRTPLSTALLYASHLSDEKVGDDQKRLFADRLKKQLMNLEKLAGNMLLFLRQRPQQMTNSPLDDLIDEACQAIQAICDERQIGLNLSLQSSGSVVNVEKQSIVSALIAILENALQVTQSGQSIAVTTIALQGRVQIMIDDQGPGIAADMMDTLFEPFSTSRITGTGLGLSIARNAIDSHRGEILVSNREGGGARFTIILPSLIEL